MDLSPDAFFDKIDANVESYTFGAYANMAEYLSAPLTILVMLYIAIQGYRMYLGYRDQTVSEYIKKSLMIGFVTAFALNWSYFSIVVDFVMETPDMLIPHLMSGHSSDSMEQKFESFYNSTASMIDSAAEEGGIVSNFVLLVVTLISYGINNLFIAIIYFLLTTARITMSVLLVLAPFVIPMYLFESSRGFFMGWVRAIVGAAFIPLLVFATSGLYIEILQQMVTEISQFTIPTTGQLFSYIICTFVCIILMFQIPAVAGSISGGFVPQSSLVGAVSAYKFLKGNGKSNKN